jgi:hypothetical protein
MKKKIGIIIGIVIVVIVAIVFGVWYVRFLRDAHSSFDKYYAFRGCSQLIERTDTYGICQTASGQTIKIVLYKNRWFLDGDLPVCSFGFCF